MTETEDLRTVDISVGDSPSNDEAMIREAVRLIDAGLSDLLHRELVSTDEVSDLLLDVRMVLTSSDVDADASVLIDHTPVGAQP